MTVVSNTSPITNLHGIGKLSLLRQLYQQIYIPPAVYEELMEGVRQGDHPPLDAEWEWIQVKTPSPTALLDTLRLQLDTGEAEAIALGIELSADLLLMDERAGRRIAAQHGLTVTGVLGVLLDAKALGYIDAIRPLMERLKQQMGFWISTELHMEILRLAGEETH
ncbi:MAG: DUF3368 domain-containing protein [Fimbriimonadales bacterium]|nr:DUF3368 domain-containing protein [Fimbriimonadales bacterium]